ncbi:DUF5807 family protein [Halolamina salifodinae]|uniref:Uncharacterized protein n=1 Tax=Halolamina salifodinae TaxID=1202767 RepID=A0A8T4GTW9_9EURY|nr:DUF5807 family protein [Halolamina salifodinae]MBP1986306.1 hypothetical protein [Halolamina salifodinae]
MSKRSEFLAGERLEDVALFLAADQLDESGKLADAGEEVDGGIVLVRPGEQGRKLFSAGTGQDAMEFAKEAMGEGGSVDESQRPSSANQNAERSGGVDADLAGGSCPAGDGDDHEVQYIFAFAEAENPEVGGMYADGDVIHAYAKCACGESYSEKWVVGSRSEE